MVARGDSDLDSCFEGRAGDGKSRDVPPSSTSGPDKYEGSEQSDQDGPSESDNGNEESVELDPKSHPLLRVTAASSISRIPRLAVHVVIGNNLERRWLGRTSIAGVVPCTQGAERQDKGKRTGKARKTISSTEY